MPLRNAFRKIILGFIALLLISDANAHPEAARANCMLQQPPNDAGENYTHGLVLKVFPRAAQISHAYSGCQLAWQHGEDGWSLAFKLYFEQGEVVAIWSPEMECKYLNRSLNKESPDECPSEPPLAMLSVTRGCLNEAKTESGDMTGKCLPDR
jgi:hypothetical protein